MKKYIFFLFCVCSFYVHGQTDSTYYWHTAIVDTTLDFYEVCKLQEAYFASRHDTNPAEAGSQNEFQRWQHFWNHRVDKSGGQPATIQGALRKYQQTFNSLQEIYQNNDNSSSDWYYYGPKGLPSQHYGVVNCVKYDRNDPTLNTYYAGTGSSGLWKTTDGGNIWRNITGQSLLQGLGVVDILTHPINPDIIFIAICFQGLGRPYYYSQGIMKTMDGGASWQQVLALAPSEQIAITKLIADPTDPDKILAFGSGKQGGIIKGKIFRSFDGENFSEVSTVPDSFCTSSIITWFTPKIVKDVVFKPGSSDVVYVATDYVEDQYAELWKISNVFSVNLSGSDFVQINKLPVNSGFPVCHRYALDIKCNNNGIPEKVFAGALDASGPGSGFFSVLEINLITSEFVTRYNVPKGDLSSWMCEFEMSDYDEAAFVTCGLFFRRFKNGIPIQTFNGFSPGNIGEMVYHTDTRSLDYITRNNKEFLLIGNDGGVTKAVRPDMESDFSFANGNGRGLYITQFYGLGVCRDTPDKIVAGAQDNNLMTFGYPGETWKVRFNGDGYDALVHPNNPNMVYYVMGGGSTPSHITRTIDGFQSSNSFSIVNKTENDNGGSNEKAMVLNPTNPEIAYVGYQNIYKAQNWVSNFDLFFDRTELPGLIQTDAVVDIAIAPSNPNIMFVAYDNKSWRDEATLAKCTTAQSTSPVWSIISDDDMLFYPKECGITAIAIAPDDPQKIWVTFGRFQPLWTGPDVKARVIYSPDGGVNFEDISTKNNLGLPNLPVNCIKVIGSSEQGYKLFIGNDIGVFMYETANPGWQLFSHHLPPCIVTDIEHILQPGKPERLRITTFGYGIWETPLDCSRNNNFEVIATNTVWNSDLIKHNNVYIAPGGVLTITANISFVEGTGLIVQPGGQLFVNGGRLTSACGSQWNGIVVYGDPAQSITNLLQQGYCVLNNAIIENAIVGVGTEGNLPDMINGDVLNRESRIPAGGIIKATNTTFQNNYIGVQINPCSQPKIDHFMRCKFEVNSDLLPPNRDPGPLVKLNDVNKVYFQGCTFITSLAFSPGRATGIGILSNNSTFFADGSCQAYNNQMECTQWKYNEFSNLDYGVKALVWSPERTFRVDRSTFTGNNTGVYASGVSLAQITRSSFQVNELDTLIREHFGGLYLDQCNGYKIEENSFASDPTSSLTWAIGAIINNSNVYPFESADNIIYNNSFSNIDIGILAQNRNRSSNGTHGLTIKCNDFISTKKYDIAVTTYNGILQGMGIANPQGINHSDKDKPAGNTFSTFSAHGNYDYRYHNEGGSFIYNHHDQNYTLAQYKVDLGPNGIYGSYGITPQFFYQNGYEKSTCCPPSYVPGGGGGIEEEKENLDVAKNKIDSTQALLDLLVDGGDTEQLAEDVQTGTPTEAVPLYNALMATSPYLSDTVIISAVQQEAVLSSAMITEVLTANPQAAKSEEVMKEVDLRMNVLTEEQISEVMTGLTTIGGKELLESQRSGNILDHTAALNNIVRYYHGDTLCTNPADSMLHYLNNSDYLWARYQAIFIQNQQSDSMTISNAMESLSQDFVLSQNDQVEHAYILQLACLENTLLGEGKSFLQADSLQRIMLTELSQAPEGIVRDYARNLLTGITGSTSYIEPYQLPSPEVKESRIKWLNIVPPKRNALKIYPNPARDYAIAEYFLKEQNQNCFVRLFNSHGESIQEMPANSRHGFCRLSIANCSAGIYVCILYCGNEQLDVVKLIIEK